jgi:hypothetical protein
MTETLDAVLAKVEDELARDRQGTSPEVAARAPAFANMTPGKISAGKSLDHLYGVRLDAEAVLGRADFSVDIGPTGFGTGRPDRAKRPRGAR